MPNPSLREQSIDRQGFDWSAAERDILNTLSDDQLAAFFRTLGFRFVGTAGDWWECHAPGREDQHPSAGVNLRDPKYPRGACKDHGGEGLYFGNPWAAAEHYRGDHWTEWRRQLADQVGIPLPDVGRPKPPPSTKPPPPPPTRPKPPPIPGKTK